MQFPTDFSNREFLPVPVVKKGEVMKTQLEISGEDVHPLAVMHYIYDIICSLGENVKLSNNYQKLTFDGICHQKDDD